MTTIYECRTSGAAVNEYLQYAENAYFDYFGNYTPNLLFSDLSSTKVPPDYRLSNIDSSITLHVSQNDPVTHPLDVAKLQSKIKAITFTQIIDDPNFTHSDFMFGINTYRIVYERIIQYWRASSCDCS